MSCNIHDNKIIPIMLSVVTQLLGNITILINPTINWGFIRNNSTTEKSQSVRTSKDIKYQKKPLWDSEMEHFTHTDNM